ncbi:MAG: alpha/beta fold hydrolase [Planctomycetota bacterium]
MRNLITVLVVLAVSPAGAAEPVPNPAHNPVENPAADAGADAGATNFRATNPDPINPDATWVRWGKANLRWMVTGSTDGADERFGVRADSDWATAPADRRRVVLIHGFNAAASSMQPIAERLRRRGHPCAVATYPNDQSITQTATRLADELQAVATRAGGAPIAVVTHSMGGLVARRVLEDPELATAGVDRLIMIAPPNHGSTLARLSIGTDLYEHVLLAEDTNDATTERRTGFYHSFDDGLGEATHDLRPGSPFLLALNRRPRNPRVDYTIILGDRGRFSDGQLERLRRALASASDKRHALGWLSPRVSALLDECDEVIAGRGDGAVAIRRGRLAGVDDVHILPATHDMIDLRGDVSDRLERLIAERL